MNINIENYYAARKNIFERFNESSTITKIVFSFLMACITGLMAQIIIPLPWTPVPITAQTLAVLCSGLFLGKKYGCLSASYFIGYITEKYTNARNFTRMFAVIGVANFALIYIPGLLGLALWFYLTQGTVLGVVELLMMGLIPFVFGDLVKIAITAGVSKVCLPKE